MSFKWQPGQLLFAGFEGLEMPEDLAGLIAAGRIGGVVLFGRNIGDPEQVRNLNAALHACAPEGAPLLIAIDQEHQVRQTAGSAAKFWPVMRRSCPSAVSRCLPSPPSRARIRISIAWRSRA